MKQLLSLVFLLNSLSVFAQEPVYTPMRLNYQFRGIKTDSLFLVPSYTDTAQANGYTVKNIGGALIRTGSDFWMRNASASAWLQNVNVGPGASPTVQFVDSVWRVAGKDSIFWRKGSVTNKIKDSTATDSPDRIDGTATNDVTSDMNSNNMVFNDVAKFLVAGNEFVVESNSVSITSHNISFQGDLSTPITWVDTTNNLTSQVRTSYYEGDIDISGADYTAYLPGFYRIVNGDATANYFFIFPDASKFTGQSVVVLNIDVDDAYISGGTFNNPDGSGVTRISSTTSATFYSDGSIWWKVSEF